MQLPGAPITAQESQEVGSSGNFMKTIHSLFKTLGDDVIPNAHLSESELTIFLDKSTILAACNKAGLRIEEIEGGYTVNGERDTMNHLDHIIRNELLDQLNGRLSHEERRELTEWRESHDDYSYYPFSISFRRSKREDTSKQTRTGVVSRIFSQFQFSK